MQFDPTTSVYDACRIIREKISEANQGQRKWLHEVFLTMNPSVPDVLQQAWSLLWILSIVISILIQWSKILYAAVRTQYEDY
jgi:hypothetical protein